MNTEMDEQLELLFKAERIRAAKVRARHAREAGSISAKSADVSRETYRKGVIVLTTFSDAGDKIKKGDESIDSLYRKTRGDETVGINIRVPYELRERIKAEADRRGVTMTSLLIDYLTQLLG